MVSTRLEASYTAKLIILLLGVLLIVGCGGTAAEPRVIEKEVIVEKEVIREVPVEKQVVVKEQVIKEVIKEIPVIKEVIKEVEVLKEIPIETVVEKLVVATPTPISGYSPGMVTGAKVDRVIYAFGELQESNRHWTVSRPSYYQFDPWAETLVGLDPKTNERIPRLANSWEASPDGRTWTFTLQKGVPFHFGWGEFTVADVLKDLELVQGADAKSLWATYMKDSSVSTEGTHEITFHMAGPTTDLPAMLSRGFGGGETSMISSAQLAKEGIEGFDKKPAGTGSYQYGGRKTGEGIWFEKAPQPHWRGENPDFNEVEIKWVREDATRLAMLLTGEAHIASLSRDLQIEAMKRGHKVVEAGVPTNYLTLYFGGLYFTKDSPHLDPLVPWVDPKVRQAMNMAIDRQEMLDFVLRGQGELMINNTFHPILRGWNPQWEKDFDKLYGYDPDKAVELLKEAGYGPDNPFEFTIWNYISSDEPETPVMIEALINYWEPVGIKVNLKDTDWGTIRKYYRNKTPQIKEGGWGNVITMRSMVTMLRNWTSTNTHWTQTDLMLDNYEKFMALQMIDDATIDDLITEVGNQRFYEFHDIPLFWFRLSVMVNPEVVESWTFPGTSGSKTSHWDLLRAAK